ncbi:IS4 family transposase [Cupriavidus necator]
MARLGLQRALDPAWIDGLFEQERETQYTRELLFSTTVEIMSLVAVGLRPSIHAAAKASQSLPVSITALYDKINRTEPRLIRALVQGCANRLEPVVQSVLCKQPLSVPGYRLRIVDGSHLPASEKRLKPLREFRGAALPGQSLVVYDPDMAMIVDLMPCEDAHTQERAIMETLLESAEPAQLWIADRNFSTRAILTGWQRRGSAFIVREHGRNPGPSELESRREIGGIETGLVYEQAVCIARESDTPLELRRIELHLDEATEDGETVIRLLSNVPATHLDAQAIARLYRKRWSIENMFQRLESVLNSEIRSLGHPRAALLGFGVAALAYNVLSVIATAVKSCHELDAGEIEISPYYLATEIRAHYAGMMIAVPAAQWQADDTLTPEQLGRMLINIATHVDPRKLRKHVRGPKVSKKKGYVAGCVARRHVSTARVMKNGCVD